MTATKSIPEFEVLGRQMAEFGVGPSDLEARINAVSDEELTDEQKRSIVTGFVDAFLNGSESRHRLQAAYSLVHGFARFTYNGDFKDMRDKVLRQFAKSSLNDSTLRWLTDDKKDLKAVKRIAELAANDNPELAYAIMPQGEKRKEFMQSIVSKYRTSPKHAELVKNALHELDDKEGLRAIGRELSITDWGPNNHILAKYGTREDYVFVAGELLKNGNVKYAYHAITFALPRGCHPAPTPEEATLFATIKRAFIKKHPQDARYAFEHPETIRGNREPHKDLDGMLQVAQQFVEQKEWDSALHTYKRANRPTTAPEVRQVALELLRNIQQYKIDHDDSFTREAIRHVAVEYFTRGGDADIAHEHIDRASAGDDVNRALGVAFARKKGKQTNPYVAGHAYSRIMAVKQKTAADEQLLGTLRTRMIDAEGASANIDFIRHNDEQGMRTYIAKFKNKYTRRAYETAIALKDAAVLEEMRQLVLGEGLATAHHVFEQEKDEQGLAYVRTQIAPGVSPAIVEHMIQLKKTK